MDANLREILRLHEMWLRGEKGGARANLSDADLINADLRGAILCGAILRGAILCGADLRDANLSNTDLSDANLCDSNLSGANLIDASLRGANLIDASLRGANLIDASLRGANLSDADLRDANLIDADLRDANLLGAKFDRANLNLANLHLATNTPFIPSACPDSGSFIGWKKAGGYIVKLEILSDSRRSSAAGRKCRCDKAKVLEIQHPNGDNAYYINSVCSDYNSRFIYKVGEIVEEPNFCDNRWVECAPGIHFFVNRQEAVEY